MRNFILLILFNGSLHANGQQTFSNSIPAYSPKDSAGSIYTITDKMAAFPGGPSGWDKYIRKYVDFSVPKKNGAPAGRYNVVILFVINESGLTTGFKPLTQHGYGMEEELTRVIEMGPRWIPASQKGKSVKSYRKQPLTFVVRQ